MPQRRSPNSMPLLHLWKCPLPRIRQPTTILDPSLDQEPTPFMEGEGELTIPYDFDVLIKFCPPFYSVRRNKDVLPLY